MQHAYLGPAAAGGGGGGAAAPAAAPAALPAAAPAALPAAAPAAALAAAPAVAPAAAAGAGAAAGGRAAHRRWQAFIAVNPLPLRALAPLIQLPLTYAGPGATLTRTGQDAYSLVVPNAKNAKNDVVNGGVSGVLNAAQAQIFIDSFFSAKGFYDRVVLELDGDVCEIAGNPGAKSPDNVAVWSAGGRADDIFGLNNDLSADADRRVEIVRRAMILSNRVYNQDPSIMPGYSAADDWADASMKSKNNLFSGALFQLMLPAELSGKTVVALNKNVCLLIAQRNL
jgi:hypothetical protein